MASTFLFCAWKRRSHPSNYRPQKKVLRSAVGRVGSIREVVSMHALKCIACLGALAAFSPNVLAQAPGYQPPRLSDGHPDLQGNWTNSSITLLERTDPSLPLKLSPDQVKRLEGQRAAQVAAGAAQTNPEAGAPPKSNDPGGYNMFWLDRGTHVGVVNGEARSSWITEPADGKMPVSADGRKRIA